MSDAGWAALASILTLIVNAVVVVMLAWIKSKQTLTDARIEQIDKNVETVHKATNSMAERLEQAAYAKGVKSETDKQGNDDTDDTTRKVDGVVDKVAGVVDKVAGVVDKVDKVVDRQKEDHTDTDETLSKVDKVISKVDGVIDRAIEHHTNPPKDTPKDKPTE